MNSVMTQEELARVFDQVTREVTENMAGIYLYEGEVSPGEDICTVYAMFERGFRSSLSLCVDTSMFTRLTQNLMRTKDVTPQDVEDFTKEYFNVLCGKIAGKMFQATKVASRFSIPAFFHGRYEPENEKDDFAIHYFSDENEGAQLVHRTPK